MDRLDQLREKMKDWQGQEGVLENGRLFYWSTDNPNGRFEWYRIGGRFENRLKLKIPRGGFLSLLGFPKKSLVNQGRLDELDFDLLTALMPPIVIHNGKWLTDPLPLSEQLGGQQSEEWKKEYLDLIKSVPLESLVTVVDIHS